MEVLVVCDGQQLVHPPTPPAPNYCLIWFEYFWFLQTHTEQIFSWLDKEHTATLSIWLSVLMN